MKEREFMKISYNVKKKRNVTFIVKGLEDLNRVYKEFDIKDLNYNTEITFEDELLSQDLDKILCKTNTIASVRNGYRHTKTQDSEYTTNIVYVHVDLTKLQNVMHDEMYKYMLTKICGIIKQKRKLRGNKK